MTVAVSSSHFHSSRCEIPRWGGVQRDKHPGTKRMTRSPLDLAAMCNVLLKACGHPGQVEEQDLEIYIGLCLAGTQMHVSRSASSGNKSVCTHTDYSTVDFGNTKIDNSCISKRIGNRLSVYGSHTIDYYTAT